MWARLRAYLGMGKTPDGKAYKPSLWLTVKAFATQAGDESLPGALIALPKGDRAVFSGHLGYEAFQDRGCLTLVAARVERPCPEAEQAEKEECPF